jgi:son of sevenless-like protein
MSVMENIHCLLNLRNFCQCGEDITTPTGSLRWYAPELVRESTSFSEKSDVWSYGMTCLEVLSGKVPYSEISRDMGVLRAIDKGQRPIRPEVDVTLQSLLASVWNLLQQCWQQDSKSRPSISAVKNFLQQIQGDLNWGLMICMAI